jgi:hypothetical protein
LFQLPASAAAHVGKGAGRGNAERLWRGGLGAVNLAGMSLFLLLAATAPQPASLRTFSDWTVGCDNGRACHAVALMPESWPEDGLRMSVRRGPEAGAAPQIAFDVGSETGVVVVAAGGKPLPLRLALDGDGMMAVAAADTPEALAAMRGASELELRKANGKRVGSVSLKGVSAALLYMDEQQRRLGTVTALVRPGAKPASAVLPPPALPNVTAAPGSSRKTALSARETAALRKRFGCGIDEVGGPDEEEVHPLGGNRLVLLACGAGAYNVSYVPIVVPAKGGVAAARHPAFDAPEAWWRGEGRPTLINASFDPARGELSSFAKARGLGDCGSGRSYVWDGARFRLTSQIDMDECRGSTDYISTWRAEVVRR